MFVLEAFLILNLSIWIHSVKVLHELQSSSCYFNGKPQQCKPPFTNIIEDVKAETTSTCGMNGPEQVCRNWYDNTTGEPRSYCSMCDAKHHSYPPSHLTDRHMPNNQTCWFSGPIQEQQDQNEVNITVALRKSFEVYYVALQICGTLPDSIAIYKSLDFGVTWKPWHFFSQDCYRAFKMPTTNEQNPQITLANIQEVLCVELKAPDGYNDFGQAEFVLPFSTTVGRPLIHHPWSEGLIEWMTMTNLKISLMRFSPVKQTFDRFKEIYSHQETFLHNPPNAFDPKSEPVVHFGLSDLAVGGRCKCNGHASRCIIDDNNEIRCDCHHNTEGQDCERCKSNYLDRPWHRATSQNANACKLCQCYNHSDKCMFSMSMFKNTRGQHGGVCLECKHNTDGQGCNECAAFHYRDITKPITHPLACISCKCHTIGSTRQNECDNKTGQCYCKDGVTGLTCDRCKVGYKQTNSTIRPCIPSTGMADMASTSPVCKKCNEKRKRIIFKKFCRRKSVFRATVQSKESHGNMIRYELKIEEIWRVDKKVWEFLPREVPAMHTYPAWINNDDVRCNCPKVSLGQSYLILTRARYYTYRQNKELYIDSRSVMLPWHDSWKRRLSKFQKREQKGKCNNYFKKMKILDKNKTESPPVQQKLSSVKQNVPNFDKFHENKYNPNYGYYGTHK